MFQTEKLIKEFVLKPTWRLFTVISFIYGIVYYLLTTINLLFPIPDRTLSLLFQGSKINNSMIKQEGENSTMPSPIPTAQHSKFSQMILTANGQIHTDTKGHAMKGMADQATPFTCKHPTVSAIFKPKTSSLLKKIFFPTGRSCCSVDFHSLERCK